MRKNMLKEKIRNGEECHRHLCEADGPCGSGAAGPGGVRLLRTGYRACGGGPGTADQHRPAADAAGITPIVRVRENQQVEILQNLDLGYAGVQVPNVDTPEQARNLVSYVKYTPLGVRGLSPSVRACDYGTCGVQEYIDTANANTMIVSHCESKTCVENLDEVLKVDGIDVIFIGPMDLSQSYGVPGKTTDPEVKAAIDTITAKTLAAGKAVGTTAASAEAAKALIAKGVQYILLSSDEGIIVKWGKETISRIRG